MNRNEVLALGRWVQAACPQQKWDKHTPDVWTEMLADYPADDCMTAVKSLVTKQTWISLADLINEVKRHRAKRFDGVNEDIFGSTAADPDDVPGYLEAVRAERKAIGDGVPVEELADAVADGRSRPVAALLGSLAEQKSIGGQQ